jgi:hypothetical protein
MLADRLARTLEALAQWRDERLHPEKYYIPLTTDEAVEREVISAPHFVLVDLRVTRKRECCRSSPGLCHQIFCLGTLAEYIKRNICMSSQTTPSKERLLLVTAKAWLYSPCSEGTRLQSAGQDDFSLSTSGVCHVTSSFFRWWLNYYRKS